MSGENRRISVIVWRDPTLDPPAYGDRMVLARFLDADVEEVECFTATSVAEHPDTFDVWAELPAPSEATVDDLEDAVLCYQWWNVDSDAGLTEGEQAEYDRLRALLPEES